MAKRSRQTAAALRRRLGGPLMAAASALLLVAAVPTSAHAASGQLTYIRADTGTVDAFFNPPNDVCLQIPGGAVRLGNDTDATVFVYPDPSCSQGWDLVGVGAQWDAPTGTAAQSVRLGSTG
ncbi:hypothetical protein ACQB60_22220 [Actinomycetota bacterium Odt1-20B]